jgi:hypothetical protein
MRSLMPFRCLMCTASRTRVHVTVIISEQPPHVGRFSLRVLQIAQQMSFSPPRASVDAANAARPSAVALFATLHREWELLALEARAGKLHGIVLVPQASGVGQALAHTGASAAAARPQTHRDASASTVSALELFLFGGAPSGVVSGSDDGSDADSSVATGKRVPAGARGAPRDSLATSPPLLLSPVAFTGFVSVHARQSPWFGATFEFSITVFPGYPMLACPLVTFCAGPLAHPELRDGTHLAIVAELFASSRRTANASPRDPGGVDSDDIVAGGMAAGAAGAAGSSCPFLLRDIVNEVRALFCQPAATFTREVALRAARLDVPFRSVTSPHFGRRDLMAQAERDVAELLAHGATPASEDDVHGGTGFVLVGHSAPTTTSLPLAAASAAEAHFTSRGDGGGGGGAPADCEFLRSDLGMILADAHIPFVAQRSDAVAAVADAAAAADAAASTTPQPQAASAPASTHQQRLEAECRKATRWIARSAPRAFAAPGSPAAPDVAIASWDAWMTRRLTRVFLPQIAHLAAPSR